MEEYEGYKLFLEDKHDEAEKKCLEDICKDATNLIPFCALLRIYSKTYDADSNVSAGRETLLYAQKLLKEFFEKKDFDFGTDPKSLQYIILLLAIGQTAREQSAVEIPCYIYEEILRLNKSDNFKVAETLLFIYVEIQGLIYGEKKTINRTADMIEELIKAFNIPDESVAVQFWKLVNSFMKKEDIVDQTKAFNEKYPTIFKVMFKEDDIKDAEIDNVTIENIKYAIRSLPDFVLATHNILRKKSAKFTKSIEDSKKEVYEDRKPDFYTFVYSMFMKNGRASLHDAKFLESVKMFTLARNVAYETALPKRFYRSEKFEFAFLSNRCTGFYQAGYLAEARQDARLTLFSKFDHFKTLDKTPEIAAAFGASEEVVELMKGWAKESPNVKSGVRREIAKKEVALLSLEGLIRSRTEPVEKIVEDLVPKDIEDLYIPLNVDASVHDLLPWLKETDLEPKTTKY